MWRILANADLLISSQIPLFGTFLQVISFLQVKLASQKDNCKAIIPAFIEKFDRFCAEIAIKLKLLTFRIFWEPIKEVIYWKKEWGHGAFKRVKHIYRSPAPRLLSPKLETTPSHKNDILQTLCASRIYPTPMAEFHWKFWGGGGFKGQTF